MNFSIFLKNLLNLNKIIFNSIIIIVILDLFMFLKSLKKTSKISGILYKNL